ncbi:MAG: histidine phosphatase family protein [Muribaculaceae bacterium]|nr:histidine phosphatase family protein [Muribaculaceae bacterium]
MRRILLISVIITIAARLCAADPTLTAYSVDDCLGTARPYPVPAGLVEPPDSLTPVFINHVGRHGARYPSSSTPVEKLLRHLHKADSAGSLTPLGRSVLEAVSMVAEASHNRWGALDSLGMAEQRGIASRMFRTFPELFRDQTVTALSSYAPRCVMSMYEFTHQLDRLNNHVEIITTAGRQNSPLMRPFDLDKAYIDWRAEKAWEQPYDFMYQTAVPTAPARRFINDPAMDSKKAQEISLLSFTVLRGIPAMGRSIDLLKFFTSEELNSMWAVENLRHYLRYTATTLSTLPAELATQLVLNLISTTDAAAAGESPATVMLRFGHAETLMPLLSLLRLRGCYYMTNYFDTVGLHWKGFDIVPMAANLRMVLFRSKKGGLYVRFDLNERPIPLLPNSDAVYTPWPVARDFMTRCIPLHLRP